MTAEAGRVHAVQEIQQGSVLAATFTHTVDTIITLDDVADFDEAGGTAILDDGTTTSTITYSSLDDTANTLTLTNAGTASFAADDAIYVNPAATERFAHIILDGEGDEGEPMVALIPNYLWDRLPLGTRAGNDDQEWVVAERIDDTWTVVDIIGITPTSDGSIGGGHSHDGTGADSVVIGGLEEEGATAALAGGARAIAVGDIASAAAADTIAIGYNASAQGARSIVIGSGGSVVPSTSPGAVLVGYNIDVPAGADSVIAIGDGIALHTNPSTVKYGIAIGYQAALPVTGSDAFYQDGYAIAIGYQAKARRRGIAIGQNAENQPLLTGVHADQIAIGNAAISSGDGPTIAIGRASSATQGSNMAIGDNAIASGSGATEVAIAIGPAARATDGQGIAIGWNATASSSGIAIGSGVAGSARPLASGSGSIALGTSTDATDESAVAIGNGAQATHLRAVAVGFLAASRYTREIRLGLIHDSHVSIAGTLQVNLVTRAATYNIPALGSGTSSMEMITRMDATAAARTVNLPPAVALEVGRVHIVRKIDASANTVTIARNGTDTIDGTASYVLANQHDEVLIYCAAVGIWHASILNGGTHALDGALHTGTLDDDQIDGTAGVTATTTNTSLWNSQAGDARKVVVYDAATGRPRWENLIATDILPPAQVTALTVEPAATLYPDDTPGSAMVASSGTDTPRFAMTYQGTATAATIDILSETYAGAPEITGTDYPTTVLTPFTSHDGPAINRGAAVSESVTFRLTATVDGQSKTRDVTMTYLNERIWGVSTEAAIDTNGEIDTFRTAQNKELSNSRSKTFSVTASATQYIYWIQRSALGTPTFTVGGFAGGFSLIATVSWTNPRGFVENYAIWRSDTIGLGSTTVVVS